jgi:hypothetical protein
LTPASQQRLPLAPSPTAIGWRASSLAAQGITRANLLLRVVAQWLRATPLSPDPLRDTALAL